jgi:hypothetical protein
MPQVFGNFLLVGKENRAVEGKIGAEEAVHQGDHRAGAGFLDKPFEDKVKD